MDVGLAVLLGGHSSVLSEGSVGSRVRRNNDTPTNMSAWIGMVLGLQKWQLALVPEMLIYRL